MARSTPPLHLLDAFAVADALDQLGLQAAIVAPNGDGDVRDRAAAEDDRSGAVLHDGYLVRVQVGKIDDLEAALDVAEERALRCRISGPPVIIEIY